MQVLFTLTTELPVYCIGLWPTREEADAFLKASGLASEKVAVTPVFYT